MNAGVREAADLLRVGDGETATIVVLSDGENNVAGSPEAALAAIDDSNAHRFDIPSGMTGLLVQRVEPLSVAYDEPCSTT